MNRELLAEVLRGMNNTAWGTTTWSVIDGDILEVEHRDGDGDGETALFRLVPVEKRYVAVDGAS